MIIAETKKDVAISSEFRTSGFTIQASAKAFEILSSNIYTNKVRAVIREISCNAHDSHVAAGQSCPIKVHLPTAIEPWFAVRDFGVGLDDDSIREIFTTYFLSTKTNSNDYTGALGLGSKSPFCLVDSFVVTAWKNGVKNTYSCYKDENGEPQIALLTSESSDEPTGLEVLLSVDNRLISEFLDEAAFVYRFFAQLPDINEKSVCNRIEEHRLAHNIITDWYGVSTQHTGLLAVMGNVAYEIPDNIVSKYYLDSINGFIRFDMGELSFNPGRESLSLDNKTIQNLEKKLSRLFDDAIQQIEQQLEAEPNKYLRFKLAHQYTNRRIANKSSAYAKALGLHSAKDFTIVKKSYGKRVSKWRSRDPEKNCEIYRYKQGFDRRAEAYVRDTGKTLMLVDDAVIAELDIPAHLILDIETLPKIQYASRSSGVKNKDIYVYNQSGGMTKTSVLPTDIKVYVELYGRENNLNPEYPAWMHNINRVRNLMRFLFTNGLVDDKFVVYGVRATTVKTKAFKNDKTWVSFQEFFNKTVDGKSFALYNELDQDHWEIIKEIYGAASNDLKQQLNFVNTKVAKYNVELPDFVKTESHPICNQVKDFMDRHSMLTLLTSWEVRRNINTVLDYINLVGAN